MNISPDLQLDIAEQTNRRIGFFGMSGSGKSNSKRVYIEEMILSGQRIGGMTIIDPNDEYGSLREIGTFVVVGDAEGCDITCDTAHAPELARRSVEMGLNIILSLSHFDDDEADEFLAAYFKALWVAQGKSRRPYLVAIEEAHEFAGQKRPSKTKAILIRIAKRGRHRGFILLFSTQRPAALDKDIVTQLNMYFLHRVVYPNDVAVYKEAVPLKPAETEALIQSLKVGQAIVVHDDGRVDTVQIRKALTSGGETPGFDAEYVPSVYQSDARVLEDLRSLLAKEMPAVPEDPEKLALHRRIGELEDQCREKDEALEASALTIEALREQIGLGASNGHTVASMQVGAIYADQINAPLAPVPMKEDDFLLVSPVTYLAQRADARAVQGSERAINRAQGLVRNMLLQITSLEGYWQEAYAYLLDHEDEPIAVTALSAALSYRVTTIANTIPRVLLDAGLIEREGRGMNASYKSVTRSVLAERYPVLPTQEIVNQIYSTISKDGSQ